MERLKVLLLCHRQVVSNAQAVVDHVRAFKRFSRHKITTVTLVASSGNLPSLLDLERFDVLVVHYSIVAVWDTYLSAAARDRIAQFGGLKVQYIQDEYRFVNATVETTRQLGMDVLFTCVPAGEIEKVYSSAALPRVRKVPVLTGYVPEDLVRRQVSAIAARPVDVGYRARKVPYWLGALGVEKWRVADGFLAATQGSSLVCDISSDEESRLYGEKWIRFLTSCKAVLGVESGASVFDFTGEIKRNVDAYVGANPHAGFDEVRARFFAAEDGKISLNQISPRCFEAIALRTAMVLFEGEYSGILSPWRHYIPLRKDFQNIDAVLRHLRDPAMLQKQVDCAFDEIARNPAYSYAGFVKLFDDVVDEEFTARVAPRRGSRRQSAGGILGRVMIPLYLSASCCAQLLVYRIWFTLPEPIREKLRPWTRFARDRRTTDARERN